MTVFDFNDEPKEEKKAPECTYTVIRSNETTASPEHPILVLDNSNRKWEHHSWGVFTNPIRKTAFEFQVEGGGTVSTDILKVDARFVSLLFKRTYISISKDLTIFHCFQIWETL